MNTAQVNDSIAWLSYSTGYATAPQRRASPYNDTKWRLPSVIGRDILIRRSRYVKYAMQMYLGAIHG
jgi:hypothetical protein